jgi:hypothetical protein
VIHDEFSASASESAEIGIVRVENRTQLMRGGTRVSEQFIQLMAEDTAELLGQGHLQMLFYCIASSRTFQRPLAETFSVGTLNKHIRIRSPDTTNSKGTLSTRAASPADLADFLTSS